MDPLLLEEEEEIIIETECPLEGAEQLSPKVEEEEDDDNDFKWDQEDPFEQFDPPIRKIKQPKRRKGDGDETGSTSRGKACTQKYKKDWENIPQFKKWLSVSIIGPEYFYCKTCKIDAKCGKSEIMRHMTSKKHARNSQSAVPKKKAFEGLLCPVFTPIDRVRYEEINYTKLTEYADYLRKQGVKALLVNDVIGEGMSLTVTERCLITEEWVKICERTKQYLMVQVGGAPFREVVRMVRHSVSKKVNAIVILPDVYNKPADHFELLRYIKEVSDHADAVPIWYHHCPKYTNVNINMRKFMLDVDEIESFVGVIFNGSALDEMVAASGVNQRLNIIYGTDYNILTAAAWGKSIMTPALNFMPKMVFNIQRATDTDSMTEARESQKCLNDVFDVINEHGHPTAAMKSAMNIISRVNVGHVRRPLVDIWKKEIDQMHNDLKSLGVIT